MRAHRRQEDAVLERIDARGPSLAESDLDRFEDGLGTRLPHDYRRFLLHWNGGAPTPAAFHVGSEISTVSRFYSLGALVPIDDLAMRQIALQRLIPAGLLAIARDVSANLICVAVLGDDYGRVLHFAIDRSSRIRQLPPSSIARQFSTFLDDLFALDQAELG